MAALQTNATSNGNGSVGTMSGPCTVYVRGSFGSALVQVQISDDNTNFVTPDKTAVPASEFRGPGSCNVSAYGTYYVRAVVSNADSTTSITAVALQ